jgi:heme-degrading monooxygenase HmoA
MFVVIVDLSVKPDSEQTLQQIFKTIFLSAISEQKGFAGVQLLQPQDAGADYRLVIQFESQVLQQAWVATPLHERVWPQIEDCCSKYAVQKFTSV